MLTPRRNGSARLRIRLRLALDFPRHGVLSYALSRSASASSRGCWSATSASTSRTAIGVLFRSEGATWPTTPARHRPRRELLRPGSAPLHASLYRSGAAAARHAALLERRASTTGTARSSEPTCASTSIPELGRRPPCGYRSSSPASALVRARVAAAVAAAADPALVSRVGQGRDRPRHAAGLARGARAATRVALGDSVRTGAGRARRARARRQPHRARLRAVRAARRNQRDAHRRGSLRGPRRGPVASST